MVGAPGDDESGNSTSGKRKSTSSISNKRTKTKLEVGCKLSRGFCHNATVVSVRTKDGAKIYKCQLDKVGMAFELPEDHLQSLSECGAKKFEVGYKFLYTVWYDAVVKSWSDEEKKYTIAHSDNDVGGLSKGELDEEMEDDTLKILGEGENNWFSRGKKVCKCKNCLMSPDEDCLVG